MQEFKGHNSYYKTFCKGLRTYNKCAPKNFTRGLHKIIFPFPICNQILYKLFFAFGCCMPINYHLLFLIFNPYPAAVYIILKKVL